MKKYSIDQFYLGIVHLGYRYGNLLTDELDPDFLQKNDLFFNMISKGAIDYREFYNNAINNNRLRYRKLFTIFYQIDDDNYLCLHNNIVYNNYSVDFCSNLEPLRNALPKMDFVYPSEINNKEALVLFDRMFNKRNLQYQYMRFPLDNFYVGSVSICDNVMVRENVYPYKKESFPMNLSEKYLLRGFFNASGYSIVKDGDNKSLEYSFGIYDTIFYCQNNVCYSINSHQVYSPTQKSDLNPEVKVYHSLEDELSDKHIRCYGRDITIPKVLKIQQKIRKRK